MMVAGKCYQVESCCNTMSVRLSCLGVIFSQALEERLRYNVGPDMELELC